MDSVCTVESDPNAAPKCDTADCVIPDCFCSADGTKVPGNLEVAQVPQMITLSFNGAINVDNIPIYQEIFAEGRTKFQIQLLTDRSKLGALLNPNPTRQG